MGTYMTPVKCWVVGAVPYEAYRYSTRTSEWTLMKTIILGAVTYNSAHVLPKFIDCVRSLDVAGYKITPIVVDNCSSDNSASLVRSAGFGLISNTENVGFGKATNQVLRSNPADLYLVVNPDVFLTADALVHMVRVMEDRIDVGIVGPRILLPSGELDAACKRGFPTPWASFTYFSGLEKLLPRTRLFGSYHRGDVADHSEGEIETIMGACMLIRSEVVRQTAGFDEDFFMYGEDIDLCLRAQKLGWKIWYDGKVSVTHAKRHTSDANPRAIAAFYDAMTIFYGKHFDASYPKFISHFVRTAISVKKARAMATLTFGVPSQVVATEAHNDNS